MVIEKYKNYVPVIHLKGDINHIQTYLPWKFEWDKCYREALNKVQKTGSNKDFGVTEDSKLYFDLSNPGPHHEAPNPTPPSFDNPRR